MRLLFVDLETTGLDPKEGVILEIAAVAVDGENELGRFHRIVRHSPRALDTMNGFVRDMHTKNGLLHDVISDKAALWEDVAIDFQTFVAPHWDLNNKIRLAGSSVHFDQRWLLEHLHDEVADLIHYRVLDVSTLRDVMKDCGLAIAKDECHRAVNDCNYALAQYRKFQETVRKGLKHG